jgi:hypothetical protein
MNRIEQLPLGPHLLLSILEFFISHYQLLLARRQLDLHLLLSNHCIVQSRRLGEQFFSSGSEGSSSGI